jgi:glycosyltransferase involved in cell wall biosynthesis
MKIDGVSKCGGKRLKGILAEGNVNEPLVTVITAIYNGQPYVAGCLESVLRQEYPNIEHIVFDGGSTDGTVDVLRQYGNRIALWRSEPDHGVYDAWNKALLEARGDWICFLGVDDELLSGAVRAYMVLAAKNPQAEYLSSNVKWVHPSGYTRILGGPWMWREFRRIMRAAHVGSMHKKSLFERYGKFDMSYQICADYEFLLRARAELRSAFMPTVTAIMRAGGLCGSGKSIYEANAAKLKTGGLPKAFVIFDLCLALIKWRTRALLYRILQALAPIRAMLGRRHSP